MVLKISAMVGIQNENRIANGVMASPATDPGPRADLVDTDRLFTEEAYGRLPPVGPVGTMLP
jgi:hypothetical protein